MPKKTNDFARLIGSIVTQHLPEQRGFQPGTRRSYEDALLLLLRYLSVAHDLCPDRIEMSDITVQRVLDWLSWLETDRGCCAKTRNARLSAIKTFFTHAQLHNLAAFKNGAAIRSIPFKRTERAVVNYLTREEIIALAGAINPERRAAARDRAMIAVAVMAGLRVSELLGTTINNIDLGRDAVMRVLGKNRKKRDLPLDVPTVRLVNDWLATRPQCSSPFLFVNWKGEQMSRDGFAYTLATNARKAGATCPSLLRKNVTPHTLRHTCAMNVLAATNDIRKVALWLGHDCVQSAEIYLHANPEEKMLILEQHQELGIERGSFEGRDLSVLETLLLGRRQRAFTAANNGEGVFDPLR